MTRAFRAACVGVGLVGVVWIARWVLPRATLDTGQGPLFRQQAGRPLLATGLVAVVLAVLAVLTALVLRTQRHPRVLASAAAVVVLAGAAVLGIGQVRYSRNRNAWPGLLAAVGTLPVPASWHEEAHRENGSDPPAVLVVWTAPGASPRTVCAALGQVLRAWAHGTTVHIGGGAPRPGQECVFFGYPRGKGFEAVVADSADDLVLSPEFGPHSVTGGNGPVVSVELRVVYFH